MKCCFTFYVKVDIKVYSSFKSYRDIKVYSSFKSYLILFVIAHDANAENKHKDLNVAISTFYLMCMLLIKVALTINRKKDEKFQVSFQKSVRQNQSYLHFSDAT